MQTFTFHTWLNTVTVESQTAADQVRCRIECKHCKLKYQSSEVLRWFLRAFKRTGSVHALSGLLFILGNGYTEQEDEEEEEEEVVEQLDTQDIYDDTAVRKVFFFCFAAGGRHSNP